MSDWNEATLGEALHIKHGFAFRGEYFSDARGDFIVLTPGNFHEGGGFKAKSGKEKFYDGPLPETFVLEAGDIVVAMTEQAPGLLGSSATIPQNRRYLHNQRIGLVCFDRPDMLDERYAYHLFNTESVRQQIQATATGTKVRHTAPERIESVRVRLPSLSIQRKVASILDALDEHIHNNNMRIEILEETVGVIYREWFVEFRYPGHQPLSSRTRSEVGAVPDGWAMTCLVEHAHLGRDNLVPSRYGTEVFDHYSIPAFDTGCLPKSEPGSQIGSGKYLIDAPAVLLSKLNPRIPRVWRVDPQVSTRRSVCSTEFLVLADGMDWPRSFIYAVVSSREFANRVTAMARGTSTSHQRTTPKDVMNLPILAPPNELVSAFVNRISPILATADCLALQRSALLAARDVLLPRLVSGHFEIDAPDLAEAV